MTFTLNERIKAFSSLGSQLKALVCAIEAGHEANLKSPAAQHFYHEIIDAPNHNPWFTVENVKLAVCAICEMLDNDKLKKWIGNYIHLIPEARYEQKKVAVIMAGNIPFVGFHDFLCVLMAGHQFLGKLSAQDKKLPVALAYLLMEIEPRFGASIEFSEGPIGGFDVVIATGSNNSARYFEHYFGKYPNIIRKNRNSIAILSGQETQEELLLLGKDVFSFFGLGCRNVSKLLFPRGYKLTELIEAWSGFKPLGDHHKFFNNYEYFKAVYIVKRAPFVDLGFCLLREDNALSSPVSVIHYEEYPFDNWVTEYLAKETDKIQCVASNNIFPGIKTIPFGKCQKPELWDYADGNDTMNFLYSINDLPIRTE